MAKKKCTSMETHVEGEPVNFIIKNHSCKMVHRDLGINAPWKVKLKMKSKEKDIKSSYEFITCKNTQSNTTFKTTFENLMIPCK